MWPLEPISQSELHRTSFATRNNLTKTQRTRSNADENAVTNLVDMLPVITVRLQVRVLLDPPVFACFASHSSTRQS